MIAAAATEGAMPNAGVTHIGSDGGGDQFDAFSEAVRSIFAAATADGSALFRTSASDLGDVYLTSLPEHRRQHHTCSCCRAFLKKFGGLAVVSSDGRVKSALWNAESVPEMYREATAAMARAVERAQIRSPFLASEAVWGTPEAGGFTHFFVTPAPAQIYHRSVLTAGQAMAAKREDFRTLSRGLAEYSRDTVAQALTLLEADALYRSEKVIGPARFLLKLHDDRASAKGPRDLVTWGAVASAPPGFCTPRSSMIGALLDDIVAGLPFEDIKRKFAAKMHPLQYLRPQAAPASGAILQAEKLVAEMGIAPSLERRFARLDDLELLWTPSTDVPAPAAGVFGHLQAKGAIAAQPIAMPAQPITWNKFARTVLPTARKIEVHMMGNMNLSALITAQHAEAPPIIQWDRPDCRNPVSSYVYHGGSRPELWGLTTGTWVPVTAVSLFPHLWHGEEKFAHHGRGAFFILKGARDTRQGGLALFPEIMKSEFHAVRAVVEAHSRSRQLEGREEATACGLAIGEKGGRDNIRVTTPIGVACYRIDRWD